MKRIILFCTVAVTLFFNSITVHAQVKARVSSGLISIDDGSIIPNEKKYATVADSLDKNLKAHPNDTASLFSRALIYVQFNGLMAKPLQGSPGALSNLTIARNMVEKAVNLKMQSFQLKVLRAQVYKELAYRFTADESWKYNSKQVAERRKLFNSYKELANKYYDELAEMDKKNAYDYRKLKVNTNYPL